MALTAAELRPYLQRLAREGRVVTYRDVAAELSVPPPRSIHRVVEALERTMEEDAAAGRPFAAALVVSKTRDGLPAPGFFAKARELGRDPGAEQGPDAAAFHRAELDALLGGASAQEEFGRNGDGAGPQSR